MIHVCHAIGCEVPVSASMLMCKEHWSKVPKHLRDLVRATYQPGQEIRKNPTREYLAVMGLAIESVRGK